MQLYLLWFRKIKLTKINGINYLFTGVVQLSAQFVAAVLLVFITINYLLWADVITFLIALLPLLLISIPSVNNHLENSGTIEKDPFIKEFKQGIRTLKLIPGLTAMIILSMFINFLIRPLDTLMSLYILIDHGGTKLIYALTLISFQGGMIFGALIASFKKEWTNRMRVIFLGIVFAGIGYTIFSIAPKGAFFIIGIGGFVLGIMLPIINSLYQTWIQTIVPKDKIGRVTSIDHTLSMSISPIGTLITGPLALLLGDANLLLYSALLMIAITIFTWSFSSIRRINYDDPSLIDSISSNIGNIKIK